MEKLNSLKEKGDILLSALKEIDEKESTGKEYREKFEYIIREQREEIVYKDEEIEFNKLKNKFFINISHEFNTPLNLIFSSLDLLELYQKKDSYSGKNKLEMPLSTIRKNANRLSRLVQNLIDITKLNADDYHLNIQSCDIVVLVDKIYNSVKKHMRKNQRKFSYHTNIEIREIKCDPINLERILLNLLSNSIKFSEKGDQVCLKLYDDYDNIYISVKDSGMGIPEEKQEYIFKAFCQLDDSLSRVAEGSGIGLALSKALVELHGGKIMLESESGNGSKFIICLPKENNIYFEQKYNNIIKDDFGSQVDIEFSDIYINQ